ERKGCQAPTCSAATCAGGCCDANKVCQAGTAATACGSGGGACLVCAGGRTCQKGVCCRSTNELCTVPSDCCSNTCLTGADGSLRCADACLAAGATCK